MNEAEIRAMNYRNARRLADLEAMPNRGKGYGVQCEVMELPTEEEAATLRRLANESAIESGKAAAKKAIDAWIENAFKIAIEKQIQKERPR